LEVSLSEDLIVFLKFIYHFEKAPFYVDFAFCTRLKLKHMCAIDLFNIDAKQAQVIQFFVILEDVASSVC